MARNSFLSGSIISKMIRRKHRNSFHSGGYCGLCGGFVGVEASDLRGIALLDYAAPELQGRSQFPAVQRPLFGDDLETLDGFEVGKIGVYLIHELLIERDNARVGHQVPACWGGDSLLRGPAFEHGEVGRDESRGELVAVADERGLVHEAIRLELVFDGLRGDGLSAGG